MFYIHSFHRFPPEESWWETRQNAAPALVNSITLLKSQATQCASPPTNPGTAQRRTQRPSPKRVTQKYYHPLPSWLGTRTLYVGTSFIGDSNYCTNTDYHLKHAAEMDDCLWIAVTVVTYKKSHFLWDMVWTHKAHGQWAQDLPSGRSLQYPPDRGWICTLCSLEVKGFSSPPTQPIS